VSRHDALPVLLVVVMLLMEVLLLLLLFKWPRRRLTSLGN
jgi:hypothetical protein